MGNITLLELHVPDGDIQLGPKSLGGSESTASTDQSEAEPVDDSSGGRSLGGLVLGIIILAAVVVMATKLLGEDGEDDDDEIAGFD